MKTIIDLRTTTEHKQQIEKLGTKVRSAKSSPPSTPTSGDNSANLSSSEGLIPSLRVSGVDYVSINFNGSAYSRYLLSQLSWLPWFKLIYLYLIGRQLDAISILASNIMRPRGLAGLAVDSLEICTAEVRTVFDILADPKRYPVLVHCTQGKDRTGLVVQLVLQLLATDKKAVMVDYLATQEELEKERAQKVEEIERIGLPASFADCDQQVVNTVDKWLNDKFGGVEPYLESCGVSKEQVDAVKSILKGSEWSLEN
jgi:protein-tyrosine phosphatase